MTQSYDLPKKLVERARREAAAELYSQHAKGIFDDGDANHPKYNGGYNYAAQSYVSIFGYEQAEFLAKQYKA